MAEISSLSNRSYDHLFKLIIVGDSCVGKTSILQRFHGETFLPVSVPTIGIIKSIKTMTNVYFWKSFSKEKLDLIPTQRH